MAPSKKEKNLDNFQAAAVSLKLFSRAELNDDKNRSLIEKLYVDPLPNEQVFKTLLANTTTIIVGRKGSGKSTVFQRVQHEVRKNKSNAISAYMDIRNVYEASQIDPVAATKIAALDSAMGPEQIQQFLLHKRFLKTLLTDIRNELKAQVEQNFLSRLRETVMGTSAEVFAGLDRIISKLDDPDYENIDGIVSLTRKQSATGKVSSKVGATAKVSANLVSAGAELGSTIEQQYSADAGAEEAHVQLLMRVIGVTDLISQLQQVLAAIGIKNLYIFLDDFSELPPDSMKILVDAIISPLSRWSDFIKFKIAAYPGRVYLGSLDTTKIEEIHLDIHGLYASAGVTKMEEKAIDFVQRLVEKRISHFCRSSPDTYFATKNPDFWRVLFYASMANPRILGHLMLYAHESNLIYDQMIGVKAIQEAAQKYYEDKVAPFFSTGKYKMVFEERSSIFSLKELLEKLVARARGLRQEGSRDGGSARPFASHFYVSTEFEDLLQTLELSFFLTKYFEQSDRTGARVAIYALNYGLCTKYQISFGRPTERREDRLYFVGRQFDYNSIVRSYMLQNQEVKCDNCPAEFELTMLPALKMLLMKCPTCGSGTCKVVNLSRKYGDVLESIGPELLLPDQELGILQTLYHENRTMVASEIASELDCSGQLVGRRAKHLSERSLVQRAAGNPVYRYGLTQQARDAYFDDAQSADLQLDEE